MDFSAGHDQSPRPSSGTQDAIRQGKEKAREVVAASLNDDSSNSPRSGRKRSRSGSFIANGKQSSTSSEDKSHQNHQDPHLRQYILRDQLHAVAQVEHEAAKVRLFHALQKETDMWKQARASNPLDPGWIYGEGFQGLGNGWTATHPNALPRIVYPKHHKRPDHRRTPRIRYNRKDRDLQKERAEDLVPVRLDLEIEKLRLRDTFTWNLNERIVAPRIFAEGLVEDFKIPDEHRRQFVEQVYSGLQEQIQDFHPHPFIEDEPLDPHLPYSAYKNDDMRIVVKLNITIGKHSLIDQFEWDINNPTNSPEDFARKMAADLCLSGEFMTAIAHSIREQTQTFTKALFIAGHPFDGRTIEDLDIRDGMLPTPVITPFRAYQAARDFAPLFFELSEADLEKTEDAFQREQRQQKRSVNRKGGPTLPELKERLRTVRTMVVSSVVPGAAESIEDSGLYRPTRRTGRGRKRYRVDDDGSDVSEISEEESPPGSPPIQGPGRARRGAASAAQAAMRAVQASSLTPEFQQPRPKRFGWHYESNPATGADGLMLRLKMPRARFREFVRELKRTPATPAMHQQPAQRMTPLRAPSNDPMARAAHADTPPPPRPTMSATPRPEPLAPGPVPQGQSQPPPPVWLTNALNALRADHPYESFIGTMRWNSKENAWQPRIKCHDCANNIMYKTDEAEPVKNFLMHFGNQEHQRIIAEKRAAKEAAGQA